LSGPGALRHGTIRDFLLGVRFVTSDGQVVFGGGKVVKNAAGFDFPKLMAGALGELGVLAELTLKVFPRPERVVTLAATFDRRDDAVAAMQRLSRSQVEPACLDLDDQRRLFVRLGGAAAALNARVARARQLIGQEAVEIDDDETWRAAREFAWLPPDYLLVKTAGPLSQLTRLLDDLNIDRYRLSLAGHVAWFAWPAREHVAPLDERLRGLGLPGLAVLGGEAPACLGRPTGDPLFARIRAALDPRGAFARAIVLQETAHAASN
jgi:glycolate oxidase FAD binding subunit